MPPSPTPATPLAVTIAQALQAAREARVDRLDAQLMLAQLMQQPRSWLIAHDDAPLSPPQAAQYAQWLTRRGAGEPLAYVLAQSEFCGLTLHVGPQVLIPRPETELLVDWGLQVLRDSLASHPQPQPCRHLTAGSQPPSG